MERIWIFAAIVAIVVAAFCLWFQLMDGAFVAAVLGCVAWFLSFRARIKKPEENS